MQNSDETSFKSTKQGILPRSQIVLMETRATKIGFQKLETIAKSNTSITIELILFIHKLCFSEILEQDAGVFRAFQVTYSGKEAPIYTKVRELMKVLIDDTEYAVSKLPSPKSDDYFSRFIEILAHFQHRFVYIHPFVDYNGRMSRMFTNYLLMRSNFPIIEINVNRKDARIKYIQSLQKADEGDYSALEHMLTNAITERFAKLV